METNNFELLDFSNEIFLEIFSNFDYIDIMYVSRVCTRFEALAKAVFGCILKNLQ